MVASEEALAIVQAYCGWHIGPTLTHELRLDGPGGHTLILPTLRLISVASVTSDGVSIAADEYDWSTAGLLRLRCGRWSCRLGGVTVTMTHGFSQIPDDINAVMARLDSRSASDPGMLAQVGQVRYQVGASGVGLGATLSDYDRAVLDRYKLPPRP